MKMKEKTNKEVNIKMKEKTNNIIKKVCMVVGVGTIFGLALSAMIYAPIVYGQTDKLLKKTHKIQIELTKKVEEKQIKDKQLIDKQIKVNSQKQIKDKQLIDKQIKVNSQKQIENNKSQQEFTKKVEEQQKKIDIKTNIKISKNKKDANTKIKNSWNHATEVGNSSQKNKKSVMNVLRVIKRVLVEFIEKSGINDEKDDRGQNLRSRLNNLNLDGWK